MIGKAVGHYRIVDTLGSGGMGVVYKAEDTRLRRHVAIKFLPESLSADDESVERFRREAQAASALSHPGICVVFDIGEHEGRPYIVMECLEGETLEQRLAVRTLDVDEVLDLAAQIAAALDVAHKAGIIHRDIKPSNVFVTRHGHAKILDFGLAKLLLEAQPETALTVGPGAQLTGPGTTLGTVAYMSPEQALGQDLDARTDIFSLGVVLYEMACGQRPFQGRTSAAVFDQILHKAPPPPDRLKAECFLALGPIVLKTLEKDPDLRYHSADELAVDLKRLQREFGQAQSSGGAAGVKAVSERNVSDPRIVAGPLRRHKLGLMGVLLGTGLAVVGFQLLGGSRPVVTGSDELLVTDFLNTTGDQVFDGALKTALTVKLAESPFLRVVPDTAVQETLRLMEKPPDTKVTAMLGREICQRRAVKAIVTGEIVQLGSRYLLTLNVEDCTSGSSLGREKSEAQTKERVLASLDTAATRLRRSLGESLGLLRQTDTPLEEATTSSLEALKAYSLAVSANSRANYPEAVTLARRAVEIDPKFAAAYHTLSTNLLNLGDDDGARVAAEKAFALRSRSSERERIAIEENYYYSVTQELERAIETLEIGCSTYPRETTFLNALGHDYIDVGREQDAIAPLQEVLRLEPNAVRSRLNLCRVYRYTGRLREARSTIEEVTSGTEAPWTHRALYLVAFLANDREEMNRQAAWLESKRALDVLAGLRLAEAAYSGRLREFRRLRQSAMAADASIEWSGQAGWSILAGAGGWPVVESLAGEKTLAERDAHRVLGHDGPSRGALPDAALALAIAGYGGAANEIAVSVSRDYPRATLWNRLVLPTIRANIELSNGRARPALDTLDVAAPFAVTAGAGLLSTYTRGQALLALNRNADAAVEFQRIIDHPGIDPFAIVHPLALLGLARAAAQTGHRVSARAHYERFFAIWKDADPDVPVLKQAKAEFQRLK